LHVLVDGNVADGRHVRSVIDEVKDGIEQSGSTVYWMWIPEPGTFAADDVLQPMVVVLGTLAFLSLFLSGFLLINTTSALLMQQVRQIGMMKSVGARNAQLIRLYFGMVLIFGVLSLAIAIPLASIVAYAITRYLAGLINFDFVGFRIPLQVVALEIAVGLLVPLAAALYPVISGVRVTVRDALNFYGVGSSQFGHGRVDRMLQRMRGPSRPVLLSMRNTIRRKARLVLTLATLALGGAIFIAVFSVRASLLTTLDQSTAYLNYDIRANLDGTYDEQTVEQDAMGVPGVAEAESWGSSNARRVRSDGQEGSSFELSAPPAATRLLRPTILQGRWLRPDDERAIVLDSDVLRSEPDLRVGDEIVLDIDRQETTWHVVGIAQTTLSATFIRIGTGYVNRAGFTQAVPSPEFSTVRIKTTQHGAAFQSSVATALQDRYESSGIRVTSITTTTASRAAIRSQFDVLIRLSLDRRDAACDRRCAELDGHHEHECPRACARSRCHAGDRRIRRRGAADLRGRGGLYRCAQRAHRRRAGDSDQQSTERYRRKQVHPRTTELYIFIQWHTVLVRARGHPRGAGQFPAGLECHTPERARGAGLRMSEPSDFHRADGCGAHRRTRLFE
jgi:putative ABC transport system permease protein